MKRGATLLLLLAGGCSSRPADQLKARPAPISTALSLSDQADGRSRTVTGVVAPIEPFRVLQGQALSNAQCGVRIGGQRVLTLGAGDLDAYTCVHLREVRALPTGKVGLLYDAESPNAALVTAVVLRRAGNQWVVMPEATTIWDDLDHQDWAAFAAALGKR